MIIIFNKYIQHLNVFLNYVVMTMMRNKNEICFGEPKFICPCGELVLILIMEPMRCCCLIRFSNYSWMVLKSIIFTLST